VQAAVVGPLLHSLQHSQQQQQPHNSSSSRRQQLHGHQLAQHCTGNLQAVLNSSSSRSSSSSLRSSGGDLPRSRLWHQWCGKAQQQQQQRLYNGRVALQLRVVYLLAGRRVKAVTSTCLGVRWISLVRKMRDCWPIGVVRLQRSVVGAGVSVGTWLSDEHEQR
jgi:hypothetical protein